MCCARIRPYTGAPARLRPPESYFEHFTEMISLSTAASFVAELPESEARRRLGVDPHITLRTLINSPNWPTVVAHMTAMALELQSSSLEQLFPGLAKFDDVELPFFQMPVCTRNILQRAEIRTWKELASWTAAELVGIHKMSEVAIQDVIRVCVEQLCATETPTGLRDLINRRDENC